MRCKFCNSDSEEIENMVITFWCDTWYDRVDNIWSQSNECKERVKNAALDKVQQDTKYYA